MRKALHLFLIVSAIFILCGFVPTPRQTLSSCRAVTPKGPARFRAAWNGAPGYLEISLPARHRFVGDDGKVVADPGPAGVDVERDQGLALWRLLDFYSSLSAEQLSDLLLISNVDLGRRGWVRLDEQGDRLAVTLGSLGETEPGLPQVWFDRATNAVAGVRAADGSWATAAPAQSRAWPAWFRVGRDTAVELLSGPEPLKVPKGAQGDPLAAWRELLPPPALPVPPPVLPAR